MKKTYVKPTTLVAQLQQQGIICGSDKVTNVDGNEGLGYQGAGDGTGDSKPRSRQYNVWDEEEDF